MKKIKCNSVNYRKGYIEVSGDIHEGCINIETWNIHPDSDISGSVFDQLSDKAFLANTEIELSVDNAKELLKLLQEAITEAETLKKSESI